MIVPNSRFTPSDNTAGPEFARLLTHNHAALLGCIYTLLPHWPDAEDLLQDAAVRMWTEFHKFQSGTSFARWGCSVAYYEVLSYRKRKRLPAVDPAAFDALAAAAADVAKDADDREAALRECLKALPAGGNSSTSCTSRG